MLRLIFGNSNRSGHLRLSLALSVGLAVFGAASGSGWVMVAAVACYVQESWATADRDIEERRRRKSWYWLPYAYALKHRSPLSHGLGVGTAVRLAYGLWPVLLLLAALSPSLLAAWIVGALINDLGHLALDL